MGQFKIISRIVRNTKRVQRNKAKTFTGHLWLTPDHGEVTKEKWKAQKGLGFCWLLLTKKGYWCRKVEYKDGSTERRCSASPRWVGREAK